MVELIALRVHRAACALRAFQHLMHRMRPPEAEARVCLLDPEHDALPPVGTETPCVAIAELFRAARQRLLHGRAPAGTEHLVQIGADAQIRILRYQLQRTVSRRVEAPRRDRLLRHMGTKLPQALRRSVRRAGIQNADTVRLLHGSYPALRKFLLIFTDRVYINSIHAASVSGPASIRNAGPHFVRIPEAPLPAGSQAAR